MASNSIDIKQRVQIPSAVQPQSYETSTLRKKQVSLDLAKQMRQITALLFDATVVFNTQLNRSNVSVHEVLEMQSSGISVSIVFATMSSDDSLSSVTSRSSSTSSLSSSDKRSRSPAKRRREKHVTFSDSKQGGVRTPCKLTRVRV